MNDKLKEKLRSKAKAVREEERNNQMYYELKSEQLKNKELYLDALRELQKLEFLQNNMKAQAQENVNAVNAAGISWLRAVENIYHKVQLAYKDIEHMTEHNEDIHNDILELRDGLFEFAQDLEEHITYRFEAFDENAQLRTDQFNAMADNREARFNAMADKRESSLNSIIDKHKLYLKDYDLKLRDYDYKLTSKIDKHNSNLKEYWNDLQREKEYHYNGMQNLGEKIINKMKEETSYFKEQYGKLSKDISDDILSGISKYKELGHQLDLKGQELQTKNLLLDLEYLQKNINQDRKHKEKERQLDERKHQEDLKHLKYLDEQEAQRIRDERKEQREMERKIQEEERQRRQKIRKIKQDKRDYESGKISKREWKKMYPDGLPYGF